MTICNSLFNKEIENLRLEDIINYFKNPKSESDIIEYKSYFEKNQENHKHKENTIFKTICAFLNSSGGLLIWGAPIERKGVESIENIYEGELSLVPKDIDRDSFMNKIINRILPIAEGIKFRQIKVKSKAFIYIIEVKQSLYKPHQFDSRFWMRNNGQTNTAPYHYVEALFKQIKYPNLSAIIEFQDVKRVGRQLKYRLHFKVILKNLSPFQNETNPKLIISINGGVHKRNNTEKVLHFGDPISINSSIDSYDLEDTEFEFLVRFGGDTSPLKITKSIVNCMNYIAPKISGNSIYSESGFKFETEILYQDKLISEIE